MTNNYQNLNIGNFNSLHQPNGRNYAPGMNPQPDINLNGAVNNNIGDYDITLPSFDNEYNTETSPSHMRLNALDSTLLEAGAYQNIEDENLRIEYKINLIEDEIKSLDKEIENAKSINDFQKADVFLMRKHSLQTELKALYESYSDTDVASKLSGDIASIFSPKTTVITKMFNKCKNFITREILPKVSKSFKSGKCVKDALTKLETLNKNVDELVTMQAPYGEADERYDKLTNYLNRANVIHFQISKTVGAPTFFDTISSIDKEKLNKTKKERANFNNMTGRQK